MTVRHKFTSSESRRVSEEIGIEWSSASFDIEQLRVGMEVELEHGRQDPATNVTDDDPLVTGKIALAHLNEFPDYYWRLRQMEKDAEMEGGIRRAFAYQDCHQHAARSGGDDSAPLEPEPRAEAQHGPSPSPVSHGLHPALTRRAPRQ